MTIVKFVISRQSQIFFKYDPIAKTFNFLCYWKKNLCKQSIERSFSKDQIYYEAHPTILFERKVILLSGFIGNLILQYKKNRNAILINPYY